VNSPISSHEAQRFLKWYARQDLFSPTAFKVTRVIIFTLAFLAFLLTSALALSVLLPKIHEMRLKNSPLARSLWIGQPGIRERQLTDEKTSQIVAALASEKYVGAEPTLSGFHQISLNFRDSTSANCNREFWGRTIREEDAVFDALKKHAGVADTGALGIIATQDLMAKLGFENRPVESLTIRFGSASNPEINVPVWFCLDLKLPYNHTFIISESSYAALYTKGHHVESNAVNSGEASEKFPKPKQIRGNEELRVFLESTDVDFLTDADGKPFVRLKKEKPMAVPSWKTLIAQLSVKLEAAGFKQPDSFADPKNITPIDPVDAMPQPFYGFDLAEVRVASVDDLKSAAAGCLEAGYPADETLVQQLEDINKAGNLFFGAILAISSLIAINSVVVIGVIQKLRCEQKVSEFGMLKAMGLTSREFTRVFKNQSTILWQRSMAWGLMVSAILSVILAGWVLRPDEYSTVIYCVLVVSLCVATVIFFLIRIAMSLATKEARLMEPIVAIEKR